MRNVLIFAAGALAMGGLLTACDQSPQNRDGATAAGDPGTAAATGGTGMADTGRDTGQGPGVGASGEVGAPVATGDLGPGSTGVNAAGTAPTATPAPASGAPN
ncbi:hypothetical protein [Phenylobacterium sp. J367]|uniref:hypothetical protein n=1 Tax=Phenylobacterium sp. J367 TaxID=2898435 RepID=UPI002151A969|nr:hypothetical protein [Phenylobacterium sp. J367]MCR5877946.1 hypothetical protein [Phenylobacterium sp. J367]